LLDVYNIHKGDSVLQLYPRVNRLALTRTRGTEVCLFLAWQPPVGQGLLILEVSRSHTTTHHSR